jgi:hypothetical protein
LDGDILVAIVFADVFARKFATSALEGVTCPDETVKE